jgi:hypothetical protein
MICFDEALVLDGVRKKIESSKTEHAMTDRELIERHIERVNIKSQAVEVQFVPPSDVVAVSSHDMAHAVEPLTKITLLVCYPESGPMNRLASASKMELRDGETSQAGRDYCQVA